MRSRGRVMMSLAGMLVAVWGNWALGAVIVNGDFSASGTPPDPLAGWTTEPLIGDPPADGGGFALFSVTGLPDAQQLQQEFVLPSTALALTFEFHLSTTDGGTTDSIPIPDSFQATLYDASFNPLFPSGVPALFPGFYSIDNSGASPEFFDPTYVSVQDLTGGVKRVTLDVSSLASQTLLLDFALFGSDDGLATQVALDNVILTQSSQPVVPEPATLAIWTAFALIAVPAHRIQARRRKRMEIATAT